MAKEDYLRKQEVLKLWGQVVDALLSTTSPLASGLGTVMSIVQNNAQNITLHDGRISDLESYFNGDTPVKAVSALGISGNTLMWSYGGVAQTAITVPYATKALNDNNGLQIDTGYLKLTGGTLMQTGSNTPLIIKGGLYNYNYASIEFVQNNGGTSLGFIGCRKSGDVIYPYYYDSDFRTIYHSGNANKSDVSWSCNNLTARGNIVTLSDVKPNSHNSGSLGTDDRTWSTLFVNDILTPAGRGLRFGISYGSYKWYNVRASLTDDKIIMQLSLTGDLSVKGGLAAAGICDLSLN